MPSVSHRREPVRGGITLPVTAGDPRRGLTKILPGWPTPSCLRNVVERRGDNVPRYRKGKGKIAPYSIADSLVRGLRDLDLEQGGVSTTISGPDLLWESHDGTEVAVQVKDLTRWAQRNGYFSYRAKPGFLVAYGRSHIGIVLRADRDGRAVMSIEGNQSDQVSKVKIDMANVTGYISPVRLMAGQYVSRRSLLADID